MLRQLRKRKNGSVYSSSAVNTEIDLVKNIVARFDLGEQFFTNFACFEHYGEQIKSLDVRLETP